MTEISKSVFSVVDYSVHNTSLEVIVAHQKLGRRYKCSGTIGIDGVVEPFSKAGYRPGTVDEEYAEKATEYAEEYVNEHLPYEMYDGDHWWYAETLRGLKFNERQEFAKLDVHELKELSSRLRQGEIELGDDE